MSINAIDPRVIRIARALAEGCDGRDDSSADAKWLHKEYLRNREIAGLSFTECRERAFCVFISLVLNGEIGD